MSDALFSIWWLYWTFCLRNIELLKTIVVIDLISLSRYIRSLSFLTAVSSKIQDVIRMLLASYLYFYFFWDLSYFTRMKPFFSQGPNFLRVDIFYNNINDCI